MKRHTKPHRRKDADAVNTGCVIGRIPVLECLRAGKRPARRLFVRAGAQDMEDIHAAAGRTPIEACDAGTLDRKSGGQMHQGVVLDAGPLPLLRLKAWLDRKAGQPALLCVLDCIQDPHNFGAIARSAAACGADGLMFGKDRSAPLSPTAAKSAAGGLEYIDLVQETNLPRALEQLKEAGYWIAGLDERGSDTVWDVDLTGPRALVIGNEGEGLRRLMRERCDWLVRIPTSGPIQSLNASVSAGIVLAECLRQRRETSP